MNLLRSTHAYNLRSGVPVVLEVSHLNVLKKTLLYSFIEAWLHKNCHSEWTLEHIEDFKETDSTNHAYFRIIFSDVREALYFKLGPYSLHNQSSVPLGFLID